VKSWKSGKFSKNGNNLIGEKDNLGKSWKGSKDRKGGKGVTNAKKGYKNGEGPKNETETKSNRKDMIKKGRSGLNIFLDDPRASSPVKKRRNGKKKFNNKSEKKVKLRSNVFIN